MGTVDLEPKLPGSQTYSDGRLSSSTYMEYTAQLYYILLYEDTRLVPKRLTGIA